MAVLISVDLRGVLDVLKQGEMLSQRINNSEYLAAFRTSRVAILALKLGATPTAPSLAEETYALVLQHNIRKAEASINGIRDQVKAAAELSGPPL